MLLWAQYNEVPTELEVETYEELKKSQRILI